MIKHEVVQQGAEERVYRATKSSGRMALGKERIEVSRFLRIGSGNELTAYGLEPRGEGRRCAA